MTTHTADCAECDFRLARVPAKDWPEGAMRPVYLFASACELLIFGGGGLAWACVFIEMNDLNPITYTHTHTYIYTTHTPNTNNPHSKNNHLHTYHIPNTTPNQ
jgi:hypothetical protein